MSFFNLKRLLPGGARKKEKLLVGIPLAGRYTEKNYDYIINLFSTTLRSWLGQTDPNFEINIACNEVPPKGTVPEDKRISYIVTGPLSRDQLLANPRADQWHKRNLLRKQVIERKPRFYFEMDADDNVSCNLVEYIRRVRDPNGYLVRTGYVFDSQSRSFFLTPNTFLPSPLFDGLCGSSVIVTLDPDENNNDASQARIRRVHAEGHSKSRQAFLKENRPAHDISFPAVIYRINHGSNMYMRLNQNERQGFVDLIRDNCTAVDAETAKRLRKEFSFPD